MSNFLKVTIACLSLIFAGLLVVKVDNLQNTSDLKVVPMPIADSGSFAAFSFGGEPVPQRTAEFRKWLSAGVKIRVRDGMGSGTIVYYDHSTGEAYVQSCGHLWNGNMSYDASKRIPVTCKIQVWYHNSEKLKNVETYNAEVLYYCNDRGYDSSLLKFKPNWIPVYFPIAPADYVYPKDSRFHSVGCDAGSEVAHYDVRYLGNRSLGGKAYDVVTTENSPRPGRSGGGLLDDSNYIGICWGTTVRNGTGNGLFTPLSAVRFMNEKNGFAWLNDVGISLARKIPIKDQNKPQGKYDSTYIPLPIDY